MALSTAMISVIFFIAYQTLGKKPYALSWALGFLACSAQWFFNLARDQFPSFESYWLTVNGLALVLITLGLKGHCERTRCRRLPRNLWPYALAVFGAIAWTTLVQPHVGISTALVPATAALTLFMSAVIVIRHREESRPAEVATAVTMVVFGFVQLAAASVAMLQGAAGDDSYRQLYMHINFLTLPAGYTGIAMFVLFMLTSDLSEQMQEIAVRDQLTGLLNRRGFGEQGDSAFASAVRAERPISVVMTDIDRFKFINDEFGHAAGDVALCHFADLLRETRRADDILARVGGEEFALVLPGTVLEDAIRIAEDLCMRVEATPIEIDGDELPMTASFGVATLSINDTCLADIVLRADRALYRSKRAGRNRVDLESSQLVRTLDGSLAPAVSS